MPNDGHERQLRRQRHADDVAVVDRPAELGERRIAHAHMHAERQLGARKLVPYRRKTRIGKQTVAGGAEDHRGARAQTLHFFQRLESLALIAQRQKTRPFEPRRSRLALPGDVSIISAEKRRFEARVGGHVRVERAGKEHLEVEAHAIHIAQARLRIGQGHTADRTMFAFSIGAELRQYIARRVGLLRARAKGVRFERAFDQPARRVIAESGFIVNRDRDEGGGRDKVQASPATFSD